MRTYGILVNPLTLGTVRLLGNALWPVRKLLCLLLGHEPLGGHYLGFYSPRQWVETCERCGQRHEIEC